MEKQRRQAARVVAGLGSVFLASQTAMKSDYCSGYNRSQCEGQMSLKVGILEEEKANR